MLFKVHIIYHKEYVHEVEAETEEEAFQLAEDEQEEHRYGFPDYEWGERTIELVKGREES